MKSKKVLIITTHFAPDIHVGAKRPTKFSKYLVRFGWEPIILTKETKHYHGIDESLLTHLPNNIQIYRVKEWNIVRDNLKNEEITSITSNTETNQNRVNRFYSNLLQYLNKVIVYDFSWMLPAILLGCRIIKKEKINLIFSTSPNHEAQIVALLLSLFTKVKWVSELRDPWTTDPDYKTIVLLKRISDKYMEKMILNGSDKIIVTAETLKENYIRISNGKCKNKIYTIYNGYDQEDFSITNNLKNPQNKYFNITYTGTWGRYRTPEYFIKGLFNLIDEKGYLKDKIRVNFIGEIKANPEMYSRIDQIINESGLNKVIQTNFKFLPHNEITSCLYKSDLLLLVESKAHAQAGVLAAKIFEYLYAKKPILALVPPNSEISYIIKKVNAGEIVDYYDTGKISNKIYEMYLKFEKGLLKYNSVNSEIKKYSRINQVRELSKIFDSLIAGEDRFANYNTH